MAGNQGNNRVVWTSEMEQFLIDNFHKMTNQQLAYSLGLKLTVTRTRCYALGLKRLELEYFTKEQVQLLRKLYKSKGDTEIAEEFAKRWHKDKGWSKNHIEKKRRYLSLKRTEEEKKAIFNRNKNLGRWADGIVKRWQNADVNPDGTIVYWKHATSDRMIPMIKVNGIYKHYTRHRWRQLGRRIKKDHNIIFKDGDTRNLSDDNLIMISNQDLARRNGKVSSVGLSDNYVASMLAFGKSNIELREELKKHPSLLELKRQQLLLNRAIKEVKR